MILKNIKNTPSFAYVIIFLAAVLSGVGLALSTRWGPGVGGDATIYMTSARNLINGRGLGLVDPSGEFRLLPYFPPFFSLVLSFLGMFGIEMVTAARWLNIFCFAGLVFIAGYSIYRFSRSLFAASIISLLLGFSPVLIPVYAWAMSEPLSAVLGFAGLVMTVYLLEKPDNKMLLVFAALSTGLSFLTRYAALAYTLAAAAGIFFLMKRKWAERIGKTLVFGIISVFPMVVWILYDVFNTTTVGSRRMETLADMLGRLQNFWPLLHEAVLFWIIPESWFYAPVYPSSINGFLVPLMVVFLLLWSGYLAAILKKRWADIDEKLVNLLVLLSGFVFVYLLIIFSVYLTTYPPITIANRMLSPIHTAVLWIIALMAVISIRFLNGKQIARIGIYIFLVFMTLFYGWRSVRIINDNYQNGLGYTSPKWQQSQTIEALKRLPSDTIIVSNETNAILFLTGRTAYPLAEIYSDHAMSTFYRYGDGDTSHDDGQKLFREGKAVLILFDTIDDQISGLYGTRTGERISTLVTGLERTFRGEDGGIFYYPQP